MKTPKHSLPQRRGAAEKGKLVLKHGDENSFESIFFLMVSSVSPRLCGGIGFIFLVCSPLFAYPDFQVFIKKNSGRAVDCAFCHANPNGPEGNGPGQLGSLAPEEFDRLNYARAAFDPGRSVNSPILNTFGNRIISDLGKKQFLDFKTHPKDLAAALGNGVDLDRDGIPDSKEFLDGTHPLKNTDGDPLTLLRINLSRNRVHVFILILATLITLWGLNNVFRGFIRVFEDEDPEK